VDVTGLATAAAEEEKNNQRDAEKTADRREHVHQPLHLRSSSTK
jgi:hypothetical protein